jgi:hypothetical protein
MVVGALAGSADATVGNLFQDGSFESPAVPAGGFSVFTTGSGTIPFWAVVGPEVAIVSGTLSGGGLTLQAQNGAQWMDLSGDANPSPTNGISQSISTQAGQEYQLSFFIGSAWLGSGGAIIAPTVDVVIGSGSRAGFTNTNVASGGFMNWQEFTTNFIATGTSTAVQFFYGNAPGTTNWVVGLDNVSVVAVPAPGVLVSIGALLSTGHRRRRGS